MYISFDDGSSWKSFQLNLPIVPITDLVIKDNNLVVATQGRSVWIIDDLTLIHQLYDANNDGNKLFKPTRKTPIDAWSEENNAKWEPVGLLE